jgi:hypothetical protein
VTHIRQLAENLLNALVLALDASRAYERTKADAEVGDLGRDVRRFVEKSVGFLNIFC